MVVDVNETEVGSGDGRGMDRNLVLRLDVVR